MTKEVKTEKKEKRIADLDKAKSMLDEQVGKSQAHLDSINNQVLAAKRSLEGLVSEKEAIQKDIETLRNKDINKVNAEVDMRFEEIKAKEEALAKKEKNIRMREEDVADYDKKLVQVREERASFIKYKEDCERELEKSKAIIAEAKNKENEINAKLDDLKGKEVVLRKKYEEYDKDRGHFEEQKKKFYVERDNFLSLNTVKEDKKNG